MIKKTNFGPLRPQTAKQVPKGPDQNYLRRNFFVDRAAG